VGSDDLTFDELVVAFDDILVEDDFREGNVRSKLVIDSEFAVVGDEI